MPPKRVSVEGVRFDNEDEKSRHGREIWRRSVILPAVTGSAEKFPGRDI